MTDKKQEQASANVRYDLDKFFSDERFARSPEIAAAKKTYDSMTDLRDFYVSAGLARLTGLWDDVGVFIDRAHSMAHLVLDQCHETRREVAVRKMKIAASEKLDARIDETLSWIQECEE